MQKTKSIVMVLVAVQIIASMSSASSAEPVSFRRDVMPVFFRAGCNSGTCHGSARGKDGFMLSLFGYDAKGDYDRIVNEWIGRRVNVALPEESLLLLKATGKVSHTGGKLFDHESQYYKTLLRWIDEGAVDDSGKLPETVDVSIAQTSTVFHSSGQTMTMQVFAKASDDSQRDVSKLAKFFSNDPSVAKIDVDGNVTAVGPGDTNVFARFSRFTVGMEVIVLPSDTGFVWPNPPKNNFIDELVFARLEKLRIAPSELSDDETFLRRVTLDLAGRPPSPIEYASFVNETRDDKRSAKIDELLEDDAFADVWAAIWAEQLRTMGGGYAPDATDVKAAEAFYQWIRKQLRVGRPLNEFVSEMVTASGSNLSYGPSNLYTMLVHKPQFEPKAFAADFSQVFLGVQIQCAECHNHPFDRWTMNDYYGFVSFFSGMKRKPGVEPRERRIYYDTSVAPAKHVIDGRPMPAKVLGAVEPVSTQGDPRMALSQWLTSENNSLFSRNLANRVWAQLMGRGVIEPVDDVRASNPPVNEPLLDALSKKLVASKFDLRSLVREICNSRVYQLDVKPNPSNVRDVRQFSHAHLRRLRADVMIDSIVAVTGVPRRFDGFPEGTKALEYYPRSRGDTEGPQFGDPFFATFGRSSRASVCACETKKEPTLSQTLHMVVGDSVRDRLGSSPTLRRILERKPPAREGLAELFVLALGRQPTEEETRSLEELLATASAGNEQSVYEDIFWSLLNSSEFSFNH